MDNKWIGLLLLLAVASMGVDAGGQSFGNITDPATPGTVGQCLVSSGTLGVKDTWGPCSGGGAPNPVTPHTLTGATPVAVVASSTVALVDVENLLLSANVTSFTLPAAAAVADGEILHVFIRQSASGGPWTVAAGTVGPFTAGAGSIVVAAHDTTGAFVTCPTIGTTQSATVPSELNANIVYQTALTEWVVESCQGVR